MDKERILKKISDEFDSYELFFLKEKAKKFESRDKDLYGVEMNEEEGIALRGIKQNKLIFSYTFEKGEGAADALVHSAKLLGPFVEADEGVILPGSFKKYPAVNFFSPTGLETDDREKTSRLIEMESLILDYDKRIVTTRNCELQEAEIEIEIVNSKGLTIQERKTLYSVFALCVAKSTTRCHGMTGHGRIPLRISI